MVSRNQNLPEVFKPSPLAAICLRDINFTAWEHRRDIFLLLTRHPLCTWLHTCAMPWNCPFKAKARLDKFRLKMRIYPGGLCFDAQSISYDVRVTADLRDDVIIPPVQRSTEDCVFVKHSEELFSWRFGCYSPSSFAPTGHQYFFFSYLLWRHFINPPSPSPSKSLFSPFIIVRNIEHQETNSHENSKNRKTRESNEQLPGNTDKFLHNFHPINRWWPAWRQNKPVSGLFTEPFW